MKKILIIGNGFDKAHGLPTDYKDFLRFISEKDENGNGVSEDKNLFDNKESVRVLESLENGKSVCDEFKESVYDNFWIRHFFNKRCVMGDRWIDFEKEIEGVIQSVLFDMEAVEPQHTIRFQNPFLDNYKNRWAWKNYEELFERLEDELKRLNRALEIYLDGYAVKAGNGVTLSQIERIKPDKLISFNYTHTYTEKYDSSIDCDHIHGNVDIGRKAENCNIVLGFDDHYLEGNETIPEVIPFEKYYQRIVNNTGAKYRKWLDDKGIDEIQCFFYGLSFSSYDGDIIRDLITCRMTGKTTIFYRDDKERARLIKNLAVVLTPSVLIEKTGGDSPSIVFEQIERQDEG